MPQRVLALALLAAVVFVLVHQPVAATWIGLGLLAYVALLWRYPPAWLIVLPTLLPVLDLTPWTGRLYFGEFDLFVLVTLAAGFWRGCAASAPSFTTPTANRLFWLLVVVNLVALGQGVSGGIDAFTGDYGHYYGALNGLRQAKGFFWAFLLLFLAGMEVRQGRPVGWLFSVGMLCGLLLACLSIVWERLLFTGPFDFSQAYRVTGLFSSMHMGGAPVDGYLAAAIPFVAVAYMYRTERLLRIWALLLFGLSMYAFLVTFSRTNYLAISVMVLFAVVGDLQLRSVDQRRRLHTVVTWLAAGGIVLSVAMPILFGGYAQSRLTRVSHDFGTRLAHWSAVLDAASGTFGDRLWGMGTGSFPRVFRDMRRERGERDAELHLLAENSNNYVRLSRSDVNDDLFLRQRVASHAPGRATLSLRLRRHGERREKLLVEICEMNILRALPECTYVVIRMNAAPAGEWAVYNRKVDLYRKGRSFFGLSRPVEVLVLNRGLSAPVDIDEVQLTDADGQALLSNGGFEQGMERWWFNSGDHLNWHVKNLYLHLLFETGGVGLSVTLALLVLALMRLLKRLESGDRFALVLIVSLAGMLTVGMFASLLDDPRTGLLFYTLLFLGLSPVTVPPQSSSRPFLPWGRLIGGLVVMAGVLAVAVLAHTSLSRHVPAREVLRMALERADIDWPWLTHALQPAPLPEFPGPAQWPLQGVRPEGFMRQRYDTSGLPEPGVAGPFEVPPGVGADRIVTNKDELIRALRQARAGDRIWLEPGTYRIKGRNVAVGASGRPDAPIFIRARRIGEVRIELETLEGFSINQSYWVFENLEINGVCAADTRCEHAFHVAGDAEGVVIRNNRLVDFNAAIKINGTTWADGMRAPDHGLIEFNTIYNTRPRRTNNPVTSLNLDNGNGWVVRGNFIADFVKQGGNYTSYGVFMKGNSKDGLIERNLFVCNWRLPYSRGIRIGLSLGGGGTGEQFCRNGSCEAEHSNGVIRNNVIARCMSDVGIYLNRAANTRVYNNTLTGTGGIDVRFPTSSASVLNNVLEGGVFERDGGMARAADNLVSPACPWLLRWMDDCTLEDWLVDSLAGDLRLKNVDRFMAMGRTESDLTDDFCGNVRYSPPDLGAVEYRAGATCLPEVGAAHR